VCAGQIPGTTSALVRNWKRPSDQLEAQGQGLSTESQPRARAFLAEVKQMRARRKTARMLMVVLLVFALCYLPISVLNVLKRSEHEGWGGEGWVRGRSSPCSTTLPQKVRPWAGRCSFLPLHLLSLYMGITIVLAPREIVKTHFSIHLVKFRVNKSTRQTKSLPSWRLCSRGKEGK
jgi:hypothetical protein